jgi:hypothetical protein
MTRRSIVNLTAFAIVAGGGMLLGARPAAAAFDGEMCAKMNKIIASQAAQCADQGGTYWTQSSCSSTSYSIISGCDF